MRHTTTRILVLSVSFLLGACGAEPTDPEKQEPADDPGGKGDAPPNPVGHLPGAEIVAVGPGGVPSFVRGDLGRVDAQALKRDPASALAGRLDDLARPFALRAADLRATRAELDALGSAHVRYVQVKDGLDVIGADLLVHVAAGGTVYAVNGTARGGWTVPVQPTFGAAKATVRAQGDEPRLSYGAARLTYLLGTAPPVLHLAWEIPAEGAIDGEPVRELVYVDAHTSTIVTRRSLLHTARNRRVHDARNAQSLPGGLAMSEGDGAHADRAVQAAYEHSGITYDCFSTLFRRDSIDGRGMTLQSTVHYGRSYNNAFWNGSQMVYGDGDGSTFVSLVLSLDVTAHELTHGVTQYTAGLVYENEPGGINEAMSDILGAACEAFSYGTVDGRTWLLGEDIYTPGTDGDALRYMDDPTRDDYSKDYYPLRIPHADSPSQWNDYGGVHGNSGIANLAFKLLTTGGRHPRGRTTVEVPALGIERAGAIFYRALSQYLSSNSSFQALRNATAQAATDLYGADAAASVHLAWDAVGVPGGNTPPPPPPSATPLDNGVAVDLSGTRGDEQLFVLDVPAGATGLRFTTSGGRGDADLYVRFGSAPTQRQFDHRSWGSTNAEDISVPTAQEGQYYVLVHAYASHSGASLVATYTTSGQ